MILGLLCHRSRHPLWFLLPPPFLRYLKWPLEELQMWPRALQSRASLSWDLGPTPLWDSSRTSWNLCTLTWACLGGGLSPRVRVHPEEGRGVGAEPQRWQFCQWIRDRCRQLKVRKADNSERDNTLNLHFLKSIGKPGVMYDSKHTAIWMWPGSWSRESYILKVMTLPWLSRIEGWVRYLHSQIRKLFSLLLKKLKLCFHPVSSWGDQ